MPFQVVVARENIEKAFVRQPNEMRQPRLKQKNGEKLITLLLDLHLLEQMGSGQAVSPITATGGGWGLALFGQGFHIPNDGAAADAESLGQISIGGSGMLRGRVP